MGTKSASALMRIAASNRLSSAPLNQVRGERRIHSFLDRSLKCTSTMRAGEHGSTTSSVLAGVGSARFSLLDGDAIAWKTVHCVEEATESCVCLVARID